jgi:hypothetical protein
VPERWFFLVRQFRNDPLSQHFAKFYAPLVERVNLPDGALSENAVLVQGHELAESFRGETLSEDCIRRAVALEDAVGYQPLGRALGFDLLCRLSKRERLALGENVRQKYVVVAAKRIERLAERDEVTRDQTGPLMDQLIEGMLAVGSGLTPINRAGRIGDYLSV